MGKKKTLGLFLLMLGLGGCPSPTGPTGRTLTWQPAPGATQQVIERRPMGGVLKPIATVPATQSEFRDTTARPETPYCYRVGAVHANGQVAYSPLSCWQPRSPWKEPTK